MRATQRIVHCSPATGSIHKKEIALSVLDEAGLSKVKESNIIGIYPGYRFQTVEGYGCAMTESTCYLLSRMDRETRREALKCWFGPDGMNACFVRMHIDSCDYSLSEYQSVKDPLADPMLESFNIDHDRQYILPVMREVLELCHGKLSVLVSPWSPPAQWKTEPELTENDRAVYGQMGIDVDFSKPGRCFGGRLKPEYYGSWAKYLVKFIQSYLAEGIPVAMLSIQNEAFAATHWDSCVWSAAQEKEFLRDHLYPALKAAGLTERIGIYVWDHNKERMIEHIDAMMDEETLDMVEGFAYHWYSGDHFEALSMLRQKYPGKVLMHSESCGLHIPGKPMSFDVPAEMVQSLPSEMQSHFQKTSSQIDYEDAVQYAHDLIGDINHGMQRWIDWNLIVDQRGGPRHVFGGFAAPLVARDDGGFTRTVSYEYILEIANTIQPAAVRIGSSVYGSGVEATAVQNKDGSIGIILLNKTNLPQDISIRWDGYITDANLPEHSLSGISINENKIRME